MHWKHRTYTQFLPFLTRKKWHILVLHTDKLFRFFLNQSEIRLYLLFFYWSGTKWTLPIWFQINLKMVNTILFRFDSLIIIKDYKAYLWVTLKLYLKNSQKPAKLIVNTRSLCSGKLLDAIILLLYYFIKLMLLPGIFNSSALAKIQGFLTGVRSNPRVSVNQFQGFGN